MMDSMEKQLDRKKITWVTPDYFLDTDLNAGLFEGLLKHFDIHWIVLFPAKKARFSESDFLNFTIEPGLTVEFIYWTSRARSVKTLLFYENVYQRIKASAPDLIYFNYVPTSPYVLPLYWRLPKNKTIVTAHDGSVKSSFSMPLISSLVFKLAFGTVKYVNMFSQTQADLFLASFNKARIFIIPLGLKDFGVSKLPKRDDNVVFFFFGSINSNKNVELLIDAACNMYDRRLRGFKVSINGYTTDWKRYEQKIKYPELFECDIRMIDNAEIPDLFSKNHYGMFPYKEMSQSGAVKVAFNYNIPVIASNLQGFTDEVKDGVNGYIFRSEDVADLERIMTDRLNNYPTEYPIMQQKIAAYNQENYSKEALVGGYLKMFNAVVTPSTKK
jgi:glycosyltransferase involved in cell wall biosynthesis